MKKPRSYSDSLANAFLNWTFDNVAALIDVAAEGFKEDLNDAGTETRDLTPEEIHKLIRAAQLDCNAMRRFLRLAQACVQQIADGTMSIEKARELSGVDDFNQHFPPEPKEDEDP